MNDPNGIGYWDGRWHVMFQWNPDAPEHRDIHWGHMSSADLLSWRDEGVALRPRPGMIDAVGVWSGVAVPDEGGVALVYSAVKDHAWNACVAVARPTGDGAWAQPHGSACGPPNIARWTDVRDPFVLSVDGHRYGIMGAGQARVESANVEVGKPPPPRRGAVLIYDADDLDRWRLLGTLLAADDLPGDLGGRGAIWECPQLVPIGGRWLLVVSWDEAVGVTTPLPDGTVVRTLGVTSYVGDLDLSGSVPHFVAETATSLDHGPDFYAPQLVVDGDRVLAWGWAWEGRGVGTNQRSAADIANSGWAGTLTFPREVVLGPAGSVRCLPARELAGLMAESLAVHTSGRGFDMSTQSPAWTISVAGEVRIDLVSESTGRVRPVWAGDDPLGISIFVDGSIVEAFTSEGSTTVRAYAEPGEVWRATTAQRPAARVLRRP